MRAGPCKDPIQRGRDEVPLPQFSQKKNSKSRTIWIQSDCHPNDHNIAMSLPLEDTLERSKLETLSCQSK